MSKEFQTNIADPTSNVDAVVTQQGALLVDTGGSVDRLQEIKSNTDQIPPDPAREGGNLAVIAGALANIPIDPAREGGVLTQIAALLTAANTLYLTALPANIAQISGAIPSVTNPLPVQLANGSQFFDPLGDSFLARYFAGQALQMQSNAAATCGAGFIPLETPSFLTGA